jgi:hypothetical protein
MGLIDPDTNWKSIKDGFSSSPNSIVILERTPESHHGSLLDVVVNNASFITVNSNLRLLCSGETEYENILQFNGKF